MLELEEDSSSSSGELTPTRKRSSQTVNQNNPSILSSLRSVLIVISSALICFAAARNTITWYVNDFSSILCQVDDDF